MDLILETARRDSRVLAVYLKGSRANENVPKDVYQDFDIMYVVQEVAPFRENPAWLDVFGEVILKQEQDDDFGYGERFGIRGDYDKSYSWLLLFADGNRIDIGVETLETMEQGKNRNRLFVPLLDKIGCLPQIPPDRRGILGAKAYRKTIYGLLQHLLLESVRCGERTGAAGDALCHDNVSWTGVAYAGTDAPVAGGDTDGFWRILRQAGEISEKLSAQRTVRPLSGNTARWGFFSFLESYRTGVYPFLADGGTNSGSTWFCFS